MKVTRLIGPIALALLAACSDTPEPTATTSPTPTQTATTSSPSPSPTATATTTPIRATQIVYALTSFDTSDRSRWGDLYLYDIARDSVRNLTSAGGASVPRFVDGKITFLASGRKDLMEIDPATGRQRRRLRIGGTFNSYAWSPDRNEVAYIEFFGNAAQRLRVHNFTTGKATTLKGLGTLDGRETGDLDSITVAWSGAGDRILVNDTYQDTNPTLRLVRRQDGKDLITPLKDVSNALWSKDEKSIYMRAAQGADSLWQQFDIATQTRRTLGLQKGSFHAALSPDGTRIAATWRDFARDSQEPAIYVLDLGTGRQIRVAKGYRDPVWLDDQTLALTRVVRCTTEAPSCDQFRYRATGTRRVTLSRAVSTIKLGTSLWDDLGKPNADVTYSPAA